MIFFSPMIAGVTLHSWLFLILCKHPTANFVSSIRKKTIPFNWTTSYHIHCYHLHLISCLILLLPSRLSLIHSKFFSKQSSHFSCRAQPPWLHFASLFSPLVQPHLSTIFWKHSHSPISETLPCCSLCLDCQVKGVLAKNGSLAEAYEWKAKEGKGC